MSHAIRRASELALDETTVTALRAVLKATADEVVQAIIDEVPSYANALSGRMGGTIRRAVRTALGHYLDLASGSATGGDGGDAAYDLGRGEVRDGRSMDALLSAYRVGARVAWRCLAAGAVPAGLPAAEVAKFAELTFAYIDELSAASAAGHADELAARGRAHERHLEHLARDLLAGASPEVLLASCQRAGWQPPASLTAVLLPAAQARPVYRALDPSTLVLDDLPDATGVLLVPDADRSRLLRQLADRTAVVGPARPWARASASYARAVRARTLSSDIRDTEDHLPELVLSADVDAFADLRARALAPLWTLPVATARRLEETLRAWLLHQGRREEVAAALFVHPQTVRYRMSQLRELFPDLASPHRVLELTLAVGLRAG
ncbi:helix-turn-helix domain-containing protein [Streptomyces anulatus]|uniref:Helix-turn-helix domain-containing protein n=1 Tax=Streptomyces anulatus TaxID=1892 RepID=A0ABZ1ZC57_STRAQ|nr:MULTISPECIES: helix-turn-helix domain-containing protein [Streptomyces]WST89956.1 helix-turn-helix domain-containing protein [Streptomyces anulatus]WSU33605.1 helix-turn-helix domain-containing protein [Streptomyces anulatus]WSU87474.1 helix-turn-helix domain-containing protein [Streptomyces anulatus]WSV79400.1 helix-turn-helix domain-containing protein [Streptomyces anulatus]